MRTENLQHGIGFACSSGSDDKVATFGLRPLLFEIRSYPPWALDTEKADVVEPGGFELQHGLAGAVEVSDLAKAYTTVSFDVSLGQGAQHVRKPRVIPNPALDEPVERRCSTADEGPYEKAAGPEHSQGLAEGDASIVSRTKMVERTEE